MAKSKSRPARWAEACAAASSALQDLKDLHEEYQEWRDGLPENLESSAVAEKLDSVLDLDIDGALDVVSDAEGMDLPLGFGKD
jgi:hypothetical protein